MLLPHPFSETLVGVRIAFVVDFMSSVSDEINKYPHVPTIVTCTSNLPWRFTNSDAFEMQNYLLTACYA
jgi:hypothetical protein